MKTMSLKLPDDLLKRLNNAAKRGKRSKSDFVRSCLEKALYDRQSELEGSCLDLAADLCGIAAGPGDLSHNKKRMAGFGR